MCALYHRNTPYGILCTSIVSGIGTPAAAVHGGAEPVCGLSKWAAGGDVACHLSCSWPTGNFKCLATMHTAPQPTAATSAAATLCTSAAAVTAATAPTIIGHVSTCYHLHRRSCCHRLSSCQRIPRCNPVRKRRHSAMSLVSPHRHTHPPTGAALNRTMYLPCTSQQSNQAWCCVLQ